jgi:hypothetical protein
VSMPRYSFTIIHGGQPQPINAFDCKDAAKKRPLVRSPICREISLSDCSRMIPTGKSRLQTQPGNQFSKSRSRRNRSKAAAARRGRIDRGGDGRMYTARRMGSDLGAIRGPDFFDGQVSIIAH